MGKESIKALGAIPIFSNIQEETLASLAALLQQESYPKGACVVRSGDRADALFILESGEVEVRKVISRDEGKYKLLTILERGNIFGEMAVFGELKEVGEELRSADVVVREDAKLWKFNYSELHRVLRDDPRSGVNILQVIVTVLSARIKMLNTELATLYELGKIIPSFHNRDELARAVFEKVMSAVEPARAGVFAVLNTFNEEFDIIHSVGGNMAAHHLELSDPLSERLMVDNSPVFVPDSAADEQFRDSWYSGKSFVACPLSHGENVLGFILLCSPEVQRAFTYNHMILLSNVCAQTGAKLSDIGRENEEEMKQRLESGRLTAGIE